MSYTPTAVDLLAKAAARAERDARLRSMLDTRRSMWADDKQWREHVAAVKDSTP